MSILSKIQGGRIGRPQKVVVSGPEGFGKSTLASRFPDPVFFDVEDSTSQLDVRRVSRADLPTLEALEEAIDEIIKGKPCKTLVIDTADWLEQMAVEAIVKKANSSKIEGIEDFGFGKGYTILRERITILLSKLDRVIAAGIHVVLLAHSKVVKFEPPDGAGPYDRYELKLSKQVASLIKEWADMFIFGNWRTQVVERDKNETGAKFKGVGGRERLMHCNRTASWDAKNRHGMKDVEPWEIDVIRKAFESVGAPWDTPCVPKAPQPTDDPADKFKPTSAPREVAPETKAVSVDASAEENQQPDAELARICTPVADAATAFLLEKRHITEGQTWEHVPAEYRARILKNPAAFLKAINGKAVAA